jgi:hypothetical protein
MDFKKKDKVGRVFIFCFYFQSNMGRIFIFCFYFQWFKNIMQTSSILLFAGDADEIWQTFEWLINRKLKKKFSMATSENTVLVSFNVQLRSKQIVPWIFISNLAWEGFLYFVFIFSGLKTTQTSSILLFWQTNNTIVFTQRVPNK